MSFAIPNAYTLAALSPRKTLWPSTYCYAATVLRSP